MQKPKGPLGLLLGWMLRRRRLRVGVRSGAPPVVPNKVFGKLYEIHLASRKVKEWNRTVYYTLKYSIGILIIGGIVASALR